LAAGAGSRIALKADGLSAPSLMARLGQQFLVFVLSHLFSAFFDDTAQSITPPHLQEPSQGVELSTAIDSLSTFFSKPGILAPSVL